MKGLEKRQDRTKSRRGTVAISSVVPAMNLTLLHFPWTTNVENAEAHVGHVTCIA